MKNNSIWEDTVKVRNYPILSDDKKVDVLIIGGGITGISSLYQFKDSSLNVILLEQNKIGFGVTGKSTGKLSFLQNDLLDKIRDNLGDKKASIYLKSQIEAITLTKDIIEKENIDCNLKKVRSYLYTDKENEIKKIKNLEEFLVNNNVKVYRGENDFVKNKYMIYVDNTYIFHPLKFIYGLLDKIKFPIYENTSIIKIERNNDDEYICYTEKNKISAKKVIIASHYPYFNLPFLFPIKGSLEKSYLSASKYKGEDVSLISYSNPFISIRNYDDYLIYLSNSHSLSSDVCDKKNFDELNKKLKDLDLKPDYLWSNIDIITNDGLPYIGKIKDNLFIGTGYNTWGLACSVLAGKILVDEVLEKKNIYSDLFNPNRINFSKCLGVFNDSYESIRGYVKGFFKGKHKIKCPHLGCDLIYNEVEKTWDCPCHGSRFSASGDCISGPANKKIKLKKD